MTATPFAPTHTVQAGGMRAWNEPDGTGPEAARLDPGLEVQVLERKADWAKVLCSNGWEAWVDGRRLVERGAALPSATDDAAPSDPAGAAGPGDTADAVASDTAVAPATDATAVDTAPADATAAGATAVAVAAPPAATDTTAMATPVPTAQPPAAGLAVRGTNVVTLVGMLAIAGGTFLDWWKVGSVGATAWDIPIKFLLTGKAGDGLDTGPVVLVLAAVLLVGLVTGKRLPSIAILAVAALVIGVAGAAVIRGLRNDPSLYPEVGLLLTIGGGVLVATDGAELWKRWSR